VCFVGLFRHQGYKHTEALARLLEPQVPFRFLRTQVLPSARRTSQCPSKWVASKAFICVMVADRVTMGEAKGPPHLPRVIHGMARWPSNPLPQKDGRDFPYHLWSCSVACTSPLQGRPPARASLSEGCLSNTPKRGPHGMMS